MLAGGKQGEGPHSKRLLRDIPGWSHLPQQYLNLKTVRLVERLLKM